MAVCSSVGAKSIMLLAAFHISRKRHCFCCGEFSPDAHTFCEISWYRHHTVLLTVKQVDALQALAGQAVARDDLTIPIAALLDVAFLGRVIHVGDAETPGEAVGPLEVIHE